MADQKRTHKWHAEPFELGVRACRGTEPCEWIYYPLPPPAESDPTPWRTRDNEAYGPDGERISCHLHGDGIGPGMLVLIVAGLLNEWERRGRPEVRR